MAASILRRSGGGPRDRLLIAVLAAVPVAAFVVPALLGHLVVPGDDLLQNFPTRALVGSLIRHGHSPVSDPYIWSGAPLLGGWNAGAAYPLTWLFAVLPAGAAWTANLVVTWWVAGIGCYAFLRASRVSALAGFLGAFSFVFGGAMTAQLSHFGLVAGMSWVPFQLLALLRLSQPSGRRRWRAGLVLGVLLALTVLAGEPRAIADAAVVLVIFTLWRVVRSPRRLELVGSVLAAGVLAGLLSAIQWLPGVEVLGTSQRAAGSFAVFAYGSLPVAWLTLLVVPDLLGGSGSFGAPAFLGGVNFVEVTGYVGLAPLTAATSLLGRIRRRARRPEWLVWEVVAAVGALLALGSNTPLGPLLARLPLYGGQRIQSRNLLEVDLALAFLLGFWLDAWLAAPTTKAQAAGRGGRLTTAVATALPGLAAAGLVMWSLFSAGGLLQGLGARAAHGPIPAGYYATVAPFLVIAVACVGLALTSPRLSGRRRATAMVSFVVIDLVVLTATSVVAVAGGPAPSSGSDPTSGGQGSIPVPIHTAGVSGVGATPRDVLRIPGRFAIYDPGLVDVSALNTVAEPDRNIWTGGYSVQGYSSLVDGVYAATTGSHAANGEGQNTLSPTAVGDSTLDQLDTSVLLTPSVSLVGASGRRSPTGARSLHRGSVASWYLGTPHAIDSVSIPAHAGGSVAGAEIGLQSPGGSVTWHPAALRSGTLKARFPGDPAAVAVLARGAAVRLGAPELRRAHAASVVANGALQDALVPPHWTFAGVDGPFAVYADRRAEPGLRLQARPAGSLQAAAVRALDGPSVEPSSARVTSPRGVIVVRAAAAIAGWRAEWQPDAGPSAALAVRRDGLVQAVTVPAGAGVLTWRYDPPGIAAGMLLSLTGLALLVLAAAGLALSRRRRLPARPQATAPRPHEPAGSDADPSRPTTAR